MCVCIFSFFSFFLYCFFETRFLVVGSGQLLKVKTSQWGSLGPGRVSHTWKMGVRGAIQWGLEILNHYERWESGFSWNVVEQGYLTSIMGNASTKGSAEWKNQRLPSSTTETSRWPVCSQTLLGLIFPIGNTDGCSWDIAPKESRGPDADPGEVAMS